MFDVIQVEVVTHLLFRVGEVKLDCGVHMHSRCLWESLEGA